MEQKKKRFLVKSDFSLAGQVSVQGHVDFLRLVNENLSLTGYETVDLLKHRTEVKLRVPEIVIRAKFVQALRIASINRRSLNLASKFSSSYKPQTEETFVKHLMSLLDAGIEKAVLVTDDGALISDATLNVGTTTKGLTEILLTVPYLLSYGRAVQEQNARLLPRRFLSPEKLNQLFDPECNEHAQYGTKSDAVFAAAFAANYFPLLYSIENSSDRSDRNKKFRFPDISRNIRLSGEGKKNILRLDEVILVNHKSLRGSVDEYPPAGRLQTFYGSQIGESRYSVVYFDYGSESVDDEFVFCRFGDRPVVANQCVYSYKSRSRPSLESKVPIKAENF